MKRIFLVDSVLFSFKKSFCKTFFACSLMQYAKRHFPSEQNVMKSHLMKFLIKINWMTLLIETHGVLTAVAGGEWS